MAIWAKDKKQQRAIAAAQAIEQAKQERAQRFNRMFCTIMQQLDLAALQKQTDKT